MTIKPKISTVLEPGAILSASWGYDQTNIDFYVVTKVNDSWVWLQPIKQVSEYDGAYMSSKEMPVMDEIEIIKPFRRKKSSSNWVSINSYTGARVWNGKPENATHYA